MGNKCPQCNLILSSRVSMKQHIMEIHHEVFDEDQDWLELMVEDEKNKYYQGMKCGVDDDARSNTSSASDLECEIKCPICRVPRQTVRALKHHLKTRHNKHKQKEIDDLVQLGKEELEKKRPRLDSDVDQPAGHSGSSSSSIKPPLKDDQH